MAICECCGQVIRKPKAAKVDVIPDPVPDPDRQGWWKYSTLHSPIAGSATFFISGKEFMADKARRAKLAIKYNSKEREAKAYDWFPVYMEHLGRQKELEAIITSEPPERPDYGNSYGTPNYAELRAAWELEVEKHKAVVWEAIKERLDIVQVVHRIDDKRKQQILRALAVTHAPNYSIKHTEAEEAEAYEY